MLRSRSSAGRVVERGRLELMVPLRMKAGRARVRILERLHLPRIVAALLLS